MKDQHPGTNVRGQVFGANDLSAQTRQSLRAASGRGHAGAAGEKAFGEAARV